MVNGLEILLQGQKKQVMTQAKIEPLGNFTNIDCLDVLMEKKFYLEE